MTEIDISDRKATSCVFLPDGNTVFMMVNSPDHPTTIMKYDVSAETVSDFLSIESVVTPEYLSGSPVKYKFETVNEDSDDPNKVLHAYGLFYPPKVSRHTDTGRSLS